MSSQFSSVAVVARRKRKDIAETVLAVEKVLKAHQLNVVFEDVTAGFLGADIKREVYPRAELPNHCDLIVVVGGDGSILGVGRDIAASGVPVLGVNRGGLGFLAGVSPARLDEQISSVLAGKFVSEKHFLLHAKIVRGDEVLAESTALNDIVVHPGSMAYMIDFGLWVDDQFVYDQRSDGVIIASPTGSTAYSLSAGGPIMHPNLDAIVIVPMFPHTLTSRPLVLRGDSKIMIEVLAAPRLSPRVNWDSQVNARLKVGDRVLIEKYHSPLNMVYPPGYDFFESCRSKLDWASRLGNRDEDE